MILQFRVYSIFLTIFFISSLSSAQSLSYKNYIKGYQKKYVRDHEVVTGKDKKYIRFFTVDEKLKITCRFEKVNNATWFSMETSGLLKKDYRVYGAVYFTIHDTAVVLNIYQSRDLMSTDKYKEHLFIPFIDATSGEESYDTGRYIDFKISDIKNDKLEVDFNKAYNPYCAYVSDKYNCPIPPKENFLPVAICAGEKAFAKPH